MLTLTHDNLDEGFNVWAKLYGLSSDALRCPIDPVPVMRWHVIFVRRMLPVAGGSGV